MKHLLLIAASMLALAACESRPAAVAPAPSAPATLEAATFCLPRQCGRIPICTANSVARCLPENGCHWECQPINPPQ